MALGTAAMPKGAGAASAEPTHRLRCCDASACRNAGGIALRQALLAARAAAGLGEAALVIQAVGCLRLCGRGPLVAADGPAGSRLWGGVPPPLAEQLLAEVLEAGGADPLAPFRLDLNHPFFRLQKPVVLERCGLVDPDSLDDALVQGAYAQLGRCVRHLPPEAVRQEVRRSGLRGRGGAGYPTGLKWDTVALQPPGPRLVGATGDVGGAPRAASCALGFSSG
jgi:bidirectional [NiFe] hydrogenase diaphorase subunit